MSHGSPNPGPTLPVKGQVGPITPVVVGTPGPFVDALTPIKAPTSSDKMCYKIVKHSSSV